MQRPLRSGLLVVVGIVIGWNAAKCVPFPRASAQQRVAPDDARAHVIDGFEVGIRKSGEKQPEEFKRYFIEIFRDTRRGNLVYVSETGSIAVVPEPVRTGREN